MNSTYPAPTYRLTIDGRDITPKVDARLEQLTLSEARSEEADQLDLVLLDLDGRLALPRKGITLNLALGFDATALIEKGTFIVDEVSHSGPPDRVTIRARSAELTSSLRRRRDQSWHAQTLGSIVQTIAARNGLTPSMDSTLAAQSIGHIDQSGESDIAFITRLGRNFDAVATVKHGRLIFLNINNTTTAAGTTLPVVNIRRSETQNHTYTAADRDSYSGVRALYANLNAAAQQSVTAGSESGNMKELPDLFANREEAQKAATAEWQRIERGTAALSLTLATGRPELMPQSLVQVSGFKSDINSIQWLAVKVSHTLSPGAGLITSLELETAKQLTDTGKAGGNGGGGGFWQ